MSSGQNEEKSTNQQSIFLSPNEPSMQSSHLHRRRFMGRETVTVITAITGDRVVIGKAELKHAQEEHFHRLPIDALLELIEKILKDPTKIFEQKKLHQYYLFYRLDSQRYLVVIVKKTDTGNYFASMYSTGNTIRNSHKDLTEIRP